MMLGIIQLIAMEGWSFQFSHIKKKKLVKILTNGLSLHVNNADESTQHGAFWAGNHPPLCPQFSTSAGQLILFLEPLERMCSESH